MAQAQQRPESSILGASAETVLFRRLTDSEPALRHFLLDRLESGEVTKSFERAAQNCSIGSHESNNIVIAEPTVSRFHCEIVIEGSRGRVRDLGSRNGTLLDGVPIRDAYLRAGSTLQIGRVSLRFRPMERTTVLPISRRTEFAGVVGRSVAMRACFAMLERAAVTDATVLIEGETGTGKSRLARAVHAESARAKEAFFTVDCGALPTNLLESELFGHRKGAFTGAVEDRVGVFEAADGGTVFLDEIAELPLELQPKLLKAIEDREVRRLGANAYRPVDVRIIAASNHDLRSGVNNGRFRADLFYRLAVIRVNVPPLRERPEDIQPIAERLLKGLGASESFVARLVTPEFVSRLQNSSWPGNVRELRNHLERCLVMNEVMDPLEGSDPHIGATQVDARVPYSEARRRAVDAFEHAYLDALLQIHDGNVTRAAEAAELDRAYVYKLLRRHRGK